VVTVAEGLETPWSVVFLPNGKMLVTERPGRLRVVSADGTKSEPVAGLPPVDARGQGGLLDVALDPDFATNNVIYWSFAEPQDGEPTTPQSRADVSSMARRRVWRTCA
jgi:glucose/arabinose dehydrogenase